MSQANSVGIVMHRFVFGICNEKEVEVNGDDLCLVRAVCAYEHPARLGVSTIDVASSNDGSWVWIQPVDAALASREAAIVQTINTRLKFSIALLDKRPLNPCR